MIIWYYIAIYNKLVKMMSQYYIYSILLQLSCQRVSHTDCFSMPTVRCCQMLIAAWLIPSNDDIYCPSAVKYYQIRLSYKYVRCCPKLTAKFFTCTYLYHIMWNGSLPCFFQHNILGLLISVLMTTMPEAIKNRPLLRVNAAC